jgi:hypothetical protein
MKIIYKVPIGVIKGIRAPRDSITHIFPNIPLRKEMGFMPISGHKIPTLDIIEEHRNPLPPTILHLVIPLFVGFRVQGLGLRISI